MGVFDYFFKSTIDNRVNKAVAKLTTNLYNENVFKFLFNDNIVMRPDNFDYIKNGFESVGAVYECVDIIVKKFIACPWIVYRVKDQKEYKKYLNLAQSPDTIPQMLVQKAKALEEVSHKQIESLLENPNPVWSGDATWELLCALYLLKGNAYLYGNAGSQQSISEKKWSEIWAIPSQMLIKSGGFMSPIKEYIMDYYIQDKPFPANQIKHFKTLNPAYYATGQNLYGTSPLQPYLYSMDILKNADKQSDKQMKNGGTFGLLTPENREDNWSDAQLDAIQQTFTDAYRSKEELARLLPLSVAVKWQQVGLNIDELGVLKLSDAKADDIYRGYHIPLQFKNQDTATYNNLPVANRKFIYDAVAPVCRRFSTDLTDFIATPYNTSQARYIIEKDFTGLPELNDDAKTTAAWLALADFLTPNQKLEVMRYGRSPAPGMDDVWQDIKKVRMQDVVDGKIQQGGSGSSDQTTDPNPEPPK
jgi:HK97 family phage portal protein